MVICGMIKTFTMDTGIITKIVGALTGDYSNLLNKPGAFVPIYILSGTWQEMGWSAIIYIAALAGVDQELYEAASIDGASRMLKNYTYLTAMYYGNNYYHVYYEDWKPDVGRI